MGGEVMMVETSHGLQQEEQVWMTRIRLRSQRRILWMRCQSHSLGESGYTHELNGFADSSVITDRQVDRILAAPQVLATAEANFYDRDEIAQSLTRQIQMADDLVERDPVWQRLQQVFRLSAVERDLLSLTIALAVDPFLRRVYGYLHDDATMTYPTLWLASMLFQWPPTASLEPDSGLVRWQLAYPIGNEQARSITSAWVADPAIASWLIRGDCTDPALGEAVSWLPTSVGADTNCLYPDTLKAIQSFLTAMEQIDRNVPLEIELVGVSGTGKRTLAMQVCAALNLDLMTADASLLLGADVPRSLALERLMRVVRLAGLSGAALYWHGWEEVNPKLWQLNQFHCGLTFLGAIAPLEPNQNQVIRRSFSLPRLTRTQQVQLWQQLTNDHPVPDAIANWLLTPAEIQKAAQVASAGTETVTTVCRQMLHRQAGELFTPLSCPYTWSDIVLPETVRQHLRELEEQARLRWQVYEEWGFGRLCPMGQGIAALFSGPSGTGKTMAAQVLARSLNMELYRVDLAGVINKYIGETEKRLKQVFDACERANVLLFFDEADALFGQRTQVKDAHDRFANIEIDYLLQRMEQFDGMAILATNRKSDLDRAFLRRIRFVVDFVQPGVEERSRLWRLALLECTPQGEPLLEGIDWEFLANKLTMTGADIKSAALGAAFLARSQGTRIAMPQVLHAARREMAKHGVAIRTGEWEG
jgi:ATP-dependent 26S proteasome regulatory subunit